MKRVASVKNQYVGINAVLEATKEGIDLESGPFERPNISFEEAIQRIERLII